MSSREGDWDPEPSPGSEPALRPASALVAETQDDREGDFDPEPEARDGFNRVANERDDEPFHSTQGRDLKQSRPFLESGSEFGWLHHMAWFLLWLVIIWIGWQFGSAIRFALSLPESFRALVLAAEITLGVVATVWIIRLVRMFAGTRPRQWSNEHTRKNREELLAYYRGLAGGRSRNGTLRDAFGKQFLEKDEKGKSRQDALKALDDLCEFEANKEDDWWNRRAVFDKFVKERADVIVSDHAKLIGIKTAASPWKIVDILAVFYNSTRMIERIAKLYGRTCSGFQALRLALRWSFNIYVSGHLGEVMEKGAEAAVGSITSALDEAVKGTGALASGIPLVGKFVAKIGEGSANAYLCKRLGDQTIESFRPISEKAPGLSSTEKWTLFRKLGVLLLLIASFAVAAFVSAELLSDRNASSEERTSASKAMEHSEVTTPQLSHSKDDKVHEVLRRITARLDENQVAMKESPTEQADPSSH